MRRENKHLFASHRSKEAERYRAAMAGAVSRCRRGINDAEWRLPRAEVLAPAVAYNIVVS